MSRAKLRRLKHRFPVWHDNRWTPIAQYGRRLNFGILEIGHVENFRVVGFEDVPSMYHPTLTQAIELAGERP